MRVKERATPFKKQHMIWCFQTVVLEKTLLRVPWTARRSNQSILKEITERIVIERNVHWKDWCWSRSSNTLATWCREPTPWKRSSCWERLRAGREGGDREWDGWMASLTQRPWVWASSGSWWWTGRPGVLQVHGVAKSQTRLSHGTTTNNYWAGHKVHSCFCASYKKHEQTFWPAQYFS